MNKNFIKKFIFDFELFKKILVQFIQNLYKKRLHF